MKAKIAVACCDDADFLVCRAVTRPLMFPDNRVGVCSTCGAAIQFRPHAPSEPRKMCMTCFHQNEAGQAPTVVITQTTADELRAIAKRRAN